MTLYKDEPGYVKFSSTTHGIKREVTVTQAEGLTVNDLLDEFKAFLLCMGYSETAYLEACKMQVDMLGGWDELGRAGGEDDSSSS